MSLILTVPAKYVLDVIEIHSLTNHEPTNALTPQCDSDITNPTHGDSSPIYDYIHPSAKQHDYIHDYIHDLTRFIQSHVDCI